MVQIPLDQCRWSKHPEEMFLSKVQTPEQKKKDQDHANVMARYGGEANYKAGRGLGT